MGQSINRQNQHMLERLNAAHKAVRELMDQGLTVIHIDIESSMPHTQILQRPGGQLAKRLKIRDAREVTRTNSQGVRESISSITVNGCRIMWSRSL